MNALLAAILSLRVRVSFRALPNNIVGLSTTDPKQIVVDLGGATNPAKIYIHECLHVLYPDWTEKEVYRAEVRLWRKTTRHERYLLYRKLFSRKYRVQFADSE
jgi:hypothetical protein